MPGLFAQIEAFFLTSILGIATGMIFHYYQLSVRYSRVGKYFLYILDFFLWIFMILVVFIAMLIINQGEMRIYVLIALLTGIIIYYRGLSGRIEPLLNKISRKSVSFLANIYRGGIKAATYICTKIKAIIMKSMKNHV